jgi:hypothetical protein
LQRIRRNREGDKLGLNERLNGDELGFELGLNPNGSDAHLLGQIPTNRLEERVHTRWPDRSAVAGALGLSWASNWVVRGADEAGQVGPMAGFHLKA